MHRFTKRKKLLRKTKMAIWFYQEYYYYYFFFVCVSAICLFATSLLGANFVESKTEREQHNRHSDNRGNMKNKEKIIFS